VYAPNQPSARCDFFSSLPQETFEPDACHLVMGDFNLSLQPSLDCSSSTTRRDPSREACAQWLAHLGVEDAWRRHHPSEKIYTGPSPRYNRLDYIFASTSLLHHYEDSGYLQLKYGGDHLAHTLQLHENSPSKGKGYWKFPKYLLQCPTVIQHVQHSASQLASKIPTDRNPGIVWESWKKRMRHWLQQYAKTFKFQQRHELARAQAALDRLAEQVRSSSSPSAQFAFEAARSDYKDCQTRFSHYHQDQSFDVHATQSERSSSFFFRPLDHSLHRVPITEVQLASGARSSNPSVIQDEFKFHWGALMGDEYCLRRKNQHLNRPHPEAIHRLTTQLTQRLDSSQSDLLNGPVMAVELSQAIQHMNPHSSPGPDGLTAGFYQIAPDAFGTILQTVFVYQKSRGVLLPSQRTSAVSLLHKKGDRALPGNYRPIALMQVDIKILTKALTYRLQQVLPSLIHPVQKGFVKGRSLHHHVRFLSDLQDWSTFEDLDAYALFLDFEKAYDRVDWNYMWCVLEAMGCGSDFIQWVQLLYTSPKVHILINNRMTSIVRPTRGVKQGDPLSALLFVMTLEPLGQLLRQAPSHGIQVTASHVGTHLFFADDCTLLGHSLSALEHQLELVQIYCAGSGAKLNLMKSVLFPLNRHLACTCDSEEHDTLDPPDDSESCCYRHLPFRSVIKSSSITYLGIPFSISMEVEQAIETINQKYFNGYRLWFRRARTVPGRLLVAQTMILSRLWHYTMHLPIPTKVIKSWQSMLNKFVLTRQYTKDSHPHALINYEFLPIPKSRGGLGVPCLQDALTQQRITMLQQFAIQAQDQDTLHWATPGSCLLNALLPHYAQWQPLDFLTFHPAKYTMSTHSYRSSHPEFALSTTLIHHPYLSGWWKEAWTTWHLLQQNSSSSSLSLESQARDLLFQPLWLARNTWLHIQRSPNGPLTSFGTGGSRPTQTFVQAFSLRSNKRCLADFASDITNLSEEGFYDKYYDLGITRLSQHRQKYQLSQLYTCLLMIWTRLEGRFSSLDLEALSQEPPEVYIPLLAFSWNEQSEVFPHIRVRTLRRSLVEQHSTDRTHPLVSLLPEVQNLSTSSYVSTHKQVCKYVLPVMSDISFRIGFRLLPVQARLRYLERLNPNAVCCPQASCQAPETERHLFFECDIPRRIWRSFQSDWSLIFDAPLKWNHLVQGILPQLHSAWQSEYKYVRVLWNILRCITFHFLWRDRNRVRFDGHQPIPVTPLLGVIFTTFSAHYRFLLRHHMHPDDRPRYGRLLDILLMSRHFGSFFQTHRSLLKLRCSPYSDPILPSDS